MDDGLVSYHRQTYFIAVAPLASWRYAFEKDFILLPFATTKNANEFQSFVGTMSI